MVNILNLMRKTANCGSVIVVNCYNLYNVYKITCSECRNSPLLGMWGFVTF